MCHSFVNRLIMVYLWQVTESDVVDIVEKVVKDSRVKSDTHAIALMALLKLSSRFPFCTELVFCVFIVLTF